MVDPPKVVTNPGTNRTRRGSTLLLWPTPNQPPLQWRLRPVFVSYNGSQENTIKNLFDGKVMFLVELFWCSKRNVAQCRKQVPSQLRSSWIAVVVWEARNLRVLYCLYLWLTGVAQGVITGIRSLCYGLGPALFGFVFYLFHVDVEKTDVVIAKPLKHNVSGLSSDFSVLRQINEVCWAAVLFIFVF